MRYCVYGGQFGSEGKGSIAEVIIKTQLSSGRKLVVMGENSPNSGHTNSVGKTRNLPASSFFADAVILGPDSVIDPVVLSQDIQDINTFRELRGERLPIPVYIHENAAWMQPSYKTMENSLVTSVGSTASGSGYARFVKCYHRIESAVIGANAEVVQRIEKLTNVSVLNNQSYLGMIRNEEWDWLFECSQGVMLDVNFGYFPYCTSRTTLPRAAIERNGLGAHDWRYVGVFRTYPIRTGGNSGPTGGKETSYNEIAVSNNVVGIRPEIATVTKRVRRIFEFSIHDFLLSLTLVRPHQIAFTHLDYLGLDPEADGDLFCDWLVDKFQDINPVHMPETELLLSDRTGEAHSFAHQLA